MEEGRGGRRIIGVRRSQGWIEQSFIKTAQPDVRAAACRVLVAHACGPIFRFHKRLCNNKGMKGRVLELLQSPIRQRSPSCEKH